MNEEKFYSFIGIIQKAGKLVSGYNNCIFEVRKDKCDLVLIAEDASDNTRDKFIRLCTGRNIPYVVYGNKDKIGLSIGRSEKSVLAIKDNGMAKVVLNMFD